MARNFWVCLGSLIVCNWPIFSSAQLLFLNQPTMVIFVTMSDRVYLYSLAEQLIWSHYTLLGDLNNFFLSQSRFSSGGTEKTIFRKNLKFSAFFLSKISNKFRIQKLNKYVNANPHSTFEFKNPKTLLMQTGRIRWCSIVHKLIITEFIICLNFLNKIPKIARFLKTGFFGPSRKKPKSREKNIFKFTCVEYLRIKYFSCIVLRAYGVTSGVRILLGVFIFII